MEQWQMPVGKKKNCLFVFKSKVCVYRNTCMCYMYIYMCVYTYIHNLLNLKENIWNNNKKICSEDTFCFTLIHIKMLEQGECLQFIAQRYSMF